MQTRHRVIRVAAVGVFLLLLAAACSSTHASSKGPATSTTSPAAGILATPNSIPFVVGERIGLPNGWLVEILKVHRPYINTSLQKPAKGRQYVALDVAMSNGGSSTETVNPNKLFWLGDSTGKVDYVVPEPGAPNGLEGRYTPNTNRAGTLVFNVPTGAELRMAFDGPLIGTQRSIWTVDPPTVGPGN